MTTDLSKLSNDELLTLEKQTAQGGNASQSGQDLSSLSNEELLSLEQSVSSQGGQSFRDPSTAPDESKSPLNILTRIKLSFADDAGREKLLKERFQAVQRLENGKFAVGDSFNNMQPIDPAKFELFGDIADIVGEIPVIVGQILGATAGAAVELPSTVVPTTVIGAGIGGGIGQSIKAGAGHLLGVREAKAKEEAVDAAIIGSFSALGQGAAQVLGKAATIGKTKLIQRTGRMMDNAKAARVGSPQEASKTAEKVAGLFKITSNVNPEATKIVWKNSSPRVFTKFNMNSKSSASIADDIVNSVTNEIDTLGTAVNQATKEVIKKTRGKANINTINLFNQLTSDLKNIGLLSKGNIINKAAITEASDAGVFGKLLEQLTNPTFIKVAKQGRFGLDAGKTTLKQFTKPTSNLTVRQALILKNQLSNVVDKLSPKGKVAAIKFLRGSKGDPTTGLAGQIDEVARIHGATKFRAANTAFDEFITAVDDVKAGGTDLTNIHSIGNLLKKGSYLNQDEIFKRSLTNLDSKTTFPMLDTIENFTAAQEFNSASPQLLRLGAIASLLGASQIEGPGGTVAGLGSAVLFGSPAGTRTLLQMGHKMGTNGFLKSAPGTVGRAVGKLSKPGLDKTATAVLTGLLRPKVE